jgi:phosphatidate phosphatase PAH1
MVRKQTADQRGATVRQVQVTIGTNNDLIIAMKLKYGRHKDIEGPYELA